MPSTSLNENQIKLLDEAILKVYKEQKRWCYLYTDTSSCVDFGGPDGDFSVNLGHDWYKHIMPFSYRSYNRNEYDSSVIKKAKEEEAMKELKERAKSIIKEYRDVAAKTKAETKNNIYDINKNIFLRNVLFTKAMR